ncbi:MAG: hypothetical protein ACRDO7_15050, partial [Nocardioidaceae bacterium]
PGRTAWERADGRAAGRLSTWLPTLAPSLRRPAQEAFYAMADGIDLDSAGAVADAFASIEHRLSAHTPSHQ